jgi:hypothetical protein
VNIAAENAKKAGLPSDWLAQQFKELSTTPEANPYRRTQAKERAEAEADLVNQEREMRRHAKLESRRQQQKQADTAPMAESSKAAAKRSPPPPVESSESLFIPDVPQEPTYRPLPLPAWYTNIKNTDRSMMKLGKTPTPEQNQASKALQSLKGYIDQYEKSSTTLKPAKVFEELRDQVHKAEVLLKVDRYVIRKARMLEVETGLPRIFASKNRDYPWDLKADAYQLYNRWREEVFEVDLLRGIKARPGKDRNADSIDPAWKGRFSAKFYGQGSLVLGQWWPTQLTTVRDGAHGSAQGGIFGEKEKGAYSIVLSGQGSYDDVDNGDEIWYSGTDGKDFTVTEATQRLIETCDVLHNEVRVFRSHQLHKKNPFRPSAGIRFDGLYQVEEKALVDREKMSYKFRLMRCKGQFPIRREHNSAGRPTKYEVDEDIRLRKDGR